MAVNNDPSKCVRYSKTPVYQYNKQKVAAKKTDKGSQKKVFNNSNDFQIMNSSSFIYNLHINLELSGDVG